MPRLTPPRGNQDSQLVQGSDPWMRGLSVNKTRLDTADRLQITEQGLRDGRLQRAALLIEGRRVITARAVIKVSVRRTALSCSVSSRIRLEHDKEIRLGHVEIGGRSLAPTCCDHGQQLEHTALARRACPAEIFLNSSHDALRVYADLLVELEHVEPSDASSASARIPFGSALAERSEKAHDTSADVRKAIERRMARSTPNRDREVEAASAICPPGGFAPRLIDALIWPTIVRHVSTRASHRI